MSLGSVLGAAAPIAAGYFMGPGGLSMGMGASIGAGAVTGMGIAALSGNDVLMGGVTGGLGGFGGGNMAAAFNPATATTVPAGSSTAVANEAMLSPYTHVGSGVQKAAQGSQLGMFSNAAAVNQGVAPTTGFASAIGPNTQTGLNSAVYTNPTPASVVPNGANIQTGTQLKTGYGTTGLNNQVEGIITDPSKAGGYTGNPAPPDTSFSGSMKRLGDGSVGKGYMKAGISTLPVIAAAFEEEEDWDWDEERPDKYDPDATLNINDQNTGINEALKEDSGLRLYADGGIVNQTPMNVNNAGANVTGGGMNVNNVGANMGLNSVSNLNQGASNIQGLGGLNVNTGGTSASEYEQSILDKPLYKDIGFTGIGGGPSRVPYDYNPGNILSGPNYTRNMDGTFTRVGPVPEDALEVQQQNIRDRMAGSGTMNLNDVGSSVMSGGMNVNNLPTAKFAMGGLTEGPGDGMSDDIPATIDNNQPAALSDGEFVVPADVVSHLGNGSTEAGSKQLYAMMDEVRQARTGRKQQGTEIDPERYMPA
jgi:hypothetical protein